MRFLLAIMAFIPLATSALASELRSVEADAYGNAIIRTNGGAKIIAVGQAGLAATFVAADTGADFTTDIIKAELAKCREVGIILKGRSYMYGVSDGDPVPQATKIICN